MSLSEFDASADWPEIGSMPMPFGFEYRSVFLHGRPKHQKYDRFWLRHPPMDTLHRAKMFSSFDALAGFREMIREKERETADARSEPDNPETET